ncbi:MAG: hypothetical protein KDC53_24115 [Saprospiraceae bacterium]|nr:hypothetical protein [Saprospiraceae bacterium]
MNFRFITDDQLFELAASKEIIPIFISGHPSEDEVRFFLDGPREPRIPYFPSFVDIVDRMLHYPLIASSIDDARYGILYRLQGISDLLRFRKEKLSDLGVLDHYWSHISQLIEHFSSADINLEPTIVWNLYKGRDDLYYFTENPIQPETVSENRDAMAIIFQVFYDNGLFREDLKVSDLIPHLHMLTGFSRGTLRKNLREKGLSDKAEWQESQIRNARLILKDAEGVIAAYQERNFPDRV